MFLKQLRIYKTINKQEENIQNIKFRETLNLIVGDNGTGKTTLLNMLDLMFGSEEIKKLYETKETKNKNSAVRNFLHANKVQAKLTLVKKWGNKDKSNFIVLQRNLYDNMCLKINNEKIDINNYLNNLQESFFNYKLKRPTFRELITKFIRLNKDETQNYLKMFIDYMTNPLKELIGFSLFNFNDKELAFEIFLRKEEKRELKKIKPEKKIYYKKTSKKKMS